MILDGGTIRGGFDADYAARIVPPQDSPLARIIGDATGASGSPRFDIEIVCAGAAPWMISVPGPPDRASLLTTPQPHILGIAANDWHQLTGFYVVNTHTRELKEAISMPIEASASDLSGGRLFLATAIVVYAFDGNKLLWSSRRVSLDGITMLSYADGVVRGFGLQPGGPEHSPIAFSIDAGSGEASGGWDLF